MTRGEFFPPYLYLYISIINSCNLRCQGCWVDVAAKQQEIDVPAMNRMIDEAKAMGNVTPLISIEGSEIVSDQRRGRGRVYSKSMEGIQNCLNYKVMTDVCTSLCQSNCDD